ncbi:MULTISPECIES: penicillin acylase family protein [Sphingomonas]|uniref:penicillin acylase family protein n=1 Tax=Sphingomonas TaxID=13687 RepID=UPI000DEF2655|nr:MULTISPECIES: penicillin acylase family protein [Sphingomonas]
MPTLPRPAALLLLLLTAAASPGEVRQWRSEAARVSIVRDDWGIAHIHGKSDADAVFGMIYAQAEDDFPRIEANYLTALGRTAEAEGEGAIWQDLRARLYVSEPELKAHYAASPAWLKRLMDAWADGLNFYLATHPQVKPRVLTRFEPWMALSFTEGSIGGDIERIDLKALAAFYGGPAIRVAARAPDTEPRGSNGIAIAPKLTSDGGTLLLINPHTSFYFRAEQQVSSDEGLDAYGAATWGQFFIYQGWNRHAGWMHTSSGVDNVDQFAYRIKRGPGGPCYVYGTACRPLGKRAITLRYRTADGRLATRQFTALMTHRGPIVRELDGRYVAFAMMDRPVAALQQSFLRTRATDLASFMQVAQLRANSSNNTVFADDKGEIALLAPQFMPVRDSKVDYTSDRIDGSDPATDWRGLHAVAALPNTLNPRGGWVFNSNDWLYSAAGPDSLKPANYPPYLDTAGESYRTIHATRLLSAPGRWSLDRLQAAAYDSAQPSFEVLVPLLVSAWQALPAGAQRSRLAEPVAALAAWDKRWGTGPIPNTVAQYWGDELTKAAVARTWGDHRNFFRHLEALPPADKLAALERGLARLQRDFGGWRVPWGEVNRFQRISSAIDSPFDDQAPSIPVGFTSNKWGSLASFGAAPKSTKRWYGTNGNSFVAVVEFTPQGPRARAVSAGGESGQPGSPHFADQAARYAAGALRPVYFTPADLAAHVERRYRPGD